MNTNVGATTKMRPGKPFLRFDRPFNDAVRSKKRSAIIEVLLRLQLPGDEARRTAERILNRRQRQH
jgi:hypothetical protein